MKTKTSITLPEDILNTLQQVCVEAKNRSEAIELAIRFFIQKRRETLREERDLKILNSKFKSLNDEAEDVLDYQVEL